MSRRYERVTYRPEGGRARTVYLEDPAEVTLLGEPCLTGTQVDRDGEDLAVDRRHVIATALIVRRVPLAMDLTYGTLTEVSR